MDTTTAFGFLLLIAGIAVLVAILRMFEIPTILKGMAKDLREIRDRLKGD